MRPVRSLAAVLGLASVLLLSCVQCQMSQAYVVFYGDSDPLSTACKQMCRQEDRDMMNCAKLNGCARFLESTNFELDKYQVCMRPCFDVSTKCFSRCADNYNFMVSSCDGSDDNKMACLLDIFQTLTTSTPIATVKNTVLVSSDEKSRTSIPLIRLLKEKGVLMFSTVKPATSTTKLYLLRWPSASYQDTQMAEATIYISYKFHK
ncbi:hypothetical protein RRG08_038441 [Elysia crispata]|uniref:Uncharacterized protein n=1 Tax=Elysia crispata TaxID=231223 RepID=A0AAE1ANE5_9GAST|nr:hypothetical protein RRG08_038441 [Elysia crispata]